ncbi:DUF4160 domain-containing protein [Acidaminococcus fermentans]|uniref:DUF4160 domain-containing protein n=1 Tax=Acidaminococcus fermentans TaxID=905 RepID=UPI00266D8491|nr:DUF4160 domain-containing protein [Acidaminococcus fermentans]
MPQLFRIGPYLIYFWSNENNPVEPVHVHITEGKPSPNTTKVWITESGGLFSATTHSKIPQRTLVMLLRIIEANSDYILQAWKKHFEKLHFYC